MHSLQNQHLTVQLLDPTVDAHRFGPRYCTGGYVFQIEDRRLGPLLTGPTYPDDFNWFDGQGIPDAFHLGALRDPKSQSTEALIPGIGVCDPANRTVSEYCTWDITSVDAMLVFATHQEMGGFAFDLRRTVELSGRVVRSTTAIRNTGRTQLPVCWFPHPFFPYVEPNDDRRLPEVAATGPLCRLPAPLEFDGNDVYTIDSDGYFRCADLSKGGAIPVACSDAGPLTILYRHPTVGLIAAAFSYPAGHILLWGNANTFSFEPYFERTVGIDRTVEWWVEYHL